MSLPRRLLIGIMLGVQSTSFAYLSLALISFLMATTKLSSLPSPHLGIYEVRWVFSTQSTGDLLAGHYMHTLHTSGRVRSNVWRADSIGSVKSG